jgi:hypothetical protein
MGNVHAGTIDSVKSWITGEALAFILSATATILAGVSGVLYQRVASAMKEAGEFLRVLGSALEDNRITREELASIVKEGRDIFAAWR